MLFRRFGAWTLQRQAEKHALKDEDNPVYLRTRKLRKKEKLVAREVEEKKRRVAEEGGRDAEVKSEVPNGNGRKQQEQYMARRRLKELKNLAREKVKQNKRKLEDNYLRSNMEERRRMRIAELTMAKV